ncbi:MAG: DNA polymerase III subunit beta [Anaeromyxobacter sp. RBG_16_69_14]|nr:MAG: DNA polymerase III subunit beta [Anaeromyxobacter sp. RBG_16_69_14]
MELKIGVQELARALARSQGIVEKKSTMPILSHVLLEATKTEGLHVSATDLDISVSSDHACEVLKEGKVAIPAKQLYEIVKALPEKDAVLKRASNNYLELKSGAAEFRIVGLPADDFPALPRFDKIQLVSVDPKWLLEMIDLTSFAVSSDETRYNLNGVFFEPSVGSLRTVATDGHRLSLAERSLEGDFQVKKGVILPRKGLGEMKKLLLEAAEGETRLGFAENSAVLQRPRVRLVMRLIDGVFPDYRQVIPRAGEKKFTVGRERLLETLRRVSLLSTDKAHAVKLELEPGTLRVLSHNPDLGEAKEEVPVQYQGEPLKIGFNARYVMDVLIALAALEPVAAQDVLLELADDLSPGVIKPGGESATIFTAVVMPMRI